MFAAGCGGYVYVVGRRREEVRDDAGRSCFVQEGLLATKLGEGARHPFIRAISAGEPLASMLDATLGLANDALHAASFTGCRVVGVEGSPVLHALLEDGVARFARDHGAHIELRAGGALEVLREQDSDAVDVVFLDPMMKRAQKSAPAFALLRAFAVGGSASQELLTEAARVARRRVVLKLARGESPPGALAFSRCEQGVHVTYWVHDV